MRQEHTRKKNVQVKIRGKKMRRPPNLQEKRRTTVLSELHVSLLNYFSAVYHIEGYIRNMIVR